MGLSVWDTWGQERFRTVTESYYRDSNGILMVYDISNNESFEDIKYWNEEIEKYAKRDVEKILIGNKTHLETQRQISIADAEKLCKQLNIQNFIETSVAIA